MCVHHRYDTKVWRPASNVRHFKIERERGESVLLHILFQGWLFFHPCFILFLPHAMKVPQNETTIPTYIHNKREKKNKDIYIVYICIFVILTNEVGYASS